jgi:hypothetical protein
MLQCKLKETAINDIDGFLNITSGMASSRHEIHLLGSL